MGGNATAEFGSVRLSAKEYNDVISELEKTFSHMNFDDDSFGFIKSYKSKESFGDVDCLITMDNSKFNNLLSESKNIKVVAKKGLSYAMQVLLPNGEYSKSFQFDYIKSSKESFNFAFKYFAYNDLGNMIHRIAQQLNLKVGHLGLTKDVYLNKDVNLIDVYSLKSQYESDKNNAASFKENIIISTDFNKTLEFLGFDVEEYEKGFDKLEDIFDFVIKSKYFKKEFFDLNNLPSKSKIRDSKRENYMKLLEYIKDKDDSKEDIYLIEPFKNDLFSGYIAKVIDVKKSFKTEKMVKERLSFKKFFPIMKKALDLKINYDEIISSNKLKNKNPYYEVHKIILKSEDIKQKAINLTKFDLNKEIEKMIKSI